jgi:single-strand DNA-binding protein
MRTVNKVILIGNITRDPAVKNTEANKKVALFTIATNRYYKTANGENKSESEFHNCVVWGTLADRCEKFLTKGKLVYAEGRLKTRVIEEEEEDKF